MYDDAFKRLSAIFLAGALLAVIDSARAQPIQATGDSRLRSGNSSIEGLSAVGVSDIGDKERDDRFWRG